MPKPTSKLYVRVNLSKIRDIDRAIAMLGERNITAKRGLTEDSIYLEYEAHSADLDRFESSQSGIIIHARAGEAALIGHNIMRSYLSVKPNLPEGLIDRIPVFVQVNRVVAESQRCYECHRRKSELGIELKVGSHRHVVALCSRNLNYSDDTSDGNWKDPIFRNDLPRYKFPAIVKGSYFEIQTFPSLITSRLLAPEPGQTVIDACAGPGRKSMHIAELMKRSGKLYAFEIDYRRKALILERARRFVIDTNNFMIVKELDASDERAVERVLNGKKADSILIDPPCTSLGTRPKIFEPAIPKWKYIEVKHVQRNILNTLSKFLKKGGRLVYSTCTLNQAENEMQIERFLREKGGEFVLEEPKISGVDIKSYLSKTEGLCKNKALKFLPKVHDSIGYFVAVLRKEEKPHASTRGSSRHWPR